ncbi:TetR/AcrR family transcriptional regulator C-terminal domain-containing protein [Actinoallomurus vinaceus]|uniref:TetR/AcrR family transcriptional regulator C-terminal domain-containing protein n=1 Tax=Actinoallomurus vinaceus TaxID=1080074 RepID=A0ABP8UKK2_9ACTN
MKLTKERIVDAGMATYAEVGYHGLSMRQVAERLGAHAGSLYYHVRNKNDLLTMMADRVCRQAYDAGTAALTALPPESTWQDEIEAQATALRRVIGEHAGGAILLAESPKMLSPGAMSIMERLLRTLLKAGVPIDHRIVAADTLLSHVTGFVLQEQATFETPAVTQETYADLLTRFPHVFEEAPRLSQDEKFRHSVRLLCTAVEALIKR